MTKKSKELTDLLDSQEYEKIVSGLSFEDSMSMLEELIEKVESGDLPLDLAVRSYERGAALVGHMRSLLHGAEKKLEVLELEKESKRSQK